MIFKETGIKNVDKWAVYKELKNAPMWYKYGIETNITCTINNELRDDDDFN